MCPFVNFAQILYHLNFSGMRHCVCGTLNHEEGSADDKTAQLNNIHEDCIPSEENIDFHSDILKCNSSDAGSNPDMCKLGFEPASNELHFTM